MVLVIESWVLNFQRRDMCVFHLNSSCVVPLILVAGSFTVTYAEE